MTTSKVLVDRYLQGRSILQQVPGSRSHKELVFLQEWLPESTMLFREIDSGNLDVIVRNVTFQTHFPGEVIYEQDDPIFNFYVVLRGSLSLLVTMEPSLKAVLQTTFGTQEMTAISVKDTRKPVKTLNKANAKKDGNATSRHLYGKEVMRLFTGDHFGERALLQKEEKALHTVRTNERVELMVISASIFNQCLYSHFQEVALKRATFFANLEWFRNWTPHLLRQLTFMVQERHYPFGECLYRQDMNMHSVQFITSGAVKISTKINQPPPEELMEKILPPKDYLPEILAEDLPEEVPSKVSMFSASLTRRSSFYESQLTTPLFTRLNSTLSQPHSLSSVQKGQRSVSASSTKRARPRRELNPRKLMGFTIHQPSPAKIIDICILGPGDTLCDIEALCKLKKHLFNAICESDVVVYQLNKFYFEALFQRRMPRVLHAMSCRAVQRVEAWDTQYASAGIHIFKPLAQVIDQITEKLVDEGAHRAGRKKPLYVPMMLAYTAIKGLGKMPVDVAPMENPSIQISSTHTSSVSLLCHPNDLSSPPVALSPFEPRIPDFERLVSMMGYSHPRFKGNRNEKSMFDSPVAINRQSHIPVPDIKRKNSIPAPLPYTTLPKLSPQTLKHPQLLATQVLDTKDVCEKVSFENIAHSLARANNPLLLSKIRAGFILAKNSAQPTVHPGFSNEEETAMKRRTSEQLSRQQSRSWKSLSAKRVTTPTVVIAARRSQSCDCRLPEAEKKPESNVVKEHPRSVDSEMTDIPKEYTGLYGKEKNRGDCLICNQTSWQQKDDQSHAPLVKTMTQVIENRTSHLLTKYRLSLAVTNTMFRKKNKL